MARETDGRRLEAVSNLPGVYRRHSEGCKRDGRCHCRYIVRWKERGRSRKQMFRSRDEAKEFKAKLDAGVRTRRPLSSQAVGDYFPAWLEQFRGRTARGLEESSRREYEISYRLHIAPLGIAARRIRDVSAPDIIEWLGEMETRGCSPTTIRKAKAALSVMMACAVESGDIAANPTAGVRYVPSPQTMRKHPRRKHRKLTAADITAILAVMEERWQAFFMLLAQTGVRVGEALGLTWEHIHLGDDPYILIEEQVYYGQRKKLKTDASRGRVPLSQSMAAWLAELRPEDAAGTAPVFPSMTGTPLNYSNVYNRVLRPALRDAGIAVQRDGEWDYQGVAFHAFRKACGSLLFAQGKTLKQVQGWLRHSQLTTTMNVYIDQVDGGLGGADVWDEILQPAGSARGHHGATEPPETTANRDSSGGPKPPSRKAIRKQPQPSGNAGTDF